MWERTGDPTEKRSASTQLETFPRLIRGRTLREEQGQRKQHSPLPCSGSTTVSSSGPGESGRDSSAEERLPVLWKTREVQLSAPMAAVAAGRGGMSVFGEEGTMAGSGDGHDGEKFPGNSLFNDERRWPWMWGTGILAGGSALCSPRFAGAPCNAGPGRSGRGHPHWPRSARDGDEL